MNSGNNTGKIGSGNYDDIINRPHHQSKKHPQMPLRSRAAQFAPFAALVGHDVMIDGASERHMEDWDSTSGIGLSRDEYVDSI